MTKHKNKINGARKTTSYRDLIPLATVKIKKTGGQGILVKNNFIITAAHCINWATDGSMVYGDTNYYYIEDIKTADGRDLKVCPIAVEPVTDIAILGPLDEQEQSEDFFAFENFCETTKPAVLSRNPCGANKAKIIENAPDFIIYEFSIHIYTHERTWISGKAKVYNDLPKMGIKTDSNIKGGTSGGPIMNDFGELVGIVSYSGGVRGVSKEGSAPLLRRALPIWIYKNMTG
jgi:hypothetical protein